jgi:hypothetical protein
MGVAGGQDASVHHVARGIRELDRRRNRPISSRLARGNTCEEPAKQSPEVHIVVRCSSVGQGDRGITRFHRRSPKNRSTATSQSLFLNKRWVCLLIQSDPSELHRNGNETTSLDPPLFEVAR